MNEVFHFLERQGPFVFFLYIFADQIGLPVPAVPVLLAAGALAGTGYVSLALVVFLALAACLIADGLWYWLGRRKGAAVLKLLCRISLEPDSCVRNAENVLAARGAKSLLIAKFVPGLSTVAPPVAGLIQMRPGWFALWDGAGAILWAGVYIGLGWMFTGQLETVFAAAADVGGWIFLIVAGVLAGYIGSKYLQRQLFLREIRVDRISPEELRKRIEAGEDIVVVDLRHSAEFEAEVVTLPGALRVAPDAIDAHMEAIPADREVVLFCT